MGSRLFPTTYKTGRYTTEVLLKPGFGACLGLPGADETPDRPKTTATGTKTGRVSHAVIEDFLRGRRHVLLIK
jgi:hypothetical protein